MAAIESDRGGFLPLGIGAGAKGPAFDRVKAWEPLFQSIRSAVGRAGRRRRGHRAPRAVGDRC